MLVNTGGAEISHLPPRGTRGTRTADKREQDVDGFSSRRGLPGRSNPSRTGLLLCLSYLSWLFHEQSRIVLTESCFSIYYSKKQKFVCVTRSLYPWNFGQAKKITSR